VLANSQTRTTSSTTNAQHGCSYIESLDDALGRALHGLGTNTTHLGGMLLLRMWLGGMAIAGSVMMVTVGSFIAEGIKRPNNY
jgi:hypothetical protein